MKKIFVIFLSIVTLSSAMFLGGCSMLSNRSEKEEMIQIVESEKMKSVIENFLKKLDSKALTSEGKIKFYEIKKDRLKYNPMGGIMIQMFINGDKNISLSVTVVEDSTTGNYEIATNSRSPKLSELLEVN
ncbi:DUF1310 family protein [Streptococcus sanguinis]|uniref:DUF1310 family protein n=1 Tax=Streptococcus sanguinis TaxID=1305 RepID=A0A3R9HXZ1_STRSA|nr:DUF1310 family protein [Streptococcus sanguinis]RSI11746.1 hypothetical protein D8887_03440 [Streptococcus sanguinis]RSI32078.1 hypothetical protein D8877_00440 [Streptococcus sanguinis]